MQLPLVPIYHVGLLRYYALVDFHVSLTRRCKTHVFLCTKLISNYPFSISTKRAYGCMPADVPYWVVALSVGCVLSQVVAASGDLFF